MNQKTKSSSFRQSPVLMSLFLILLLALTFTLTAFIFYFLEKSEQTVSVTIDNDVYTIHQLTELEDIVTKHYPMKMSIDIVDENENVIDKKSLSLEEIDGSYFSPQVLERFSAKDKNIFAFLIKRLSTMQQQKDIVLKGDHIFYDEQKLKEWVVHNLKPINKAKQEAGLSAQGDTVSFLPGQDGVAIDLAESVQAMKEALEKSASLYVRIPATLDPADRELEHYLMDFNRVLGTASEEFQADEKLQTQMNFLLEQLNSKTIFKGTSFNFHDVLVAAYGQDEELTLGDEAEEAVARILNLMYRGAAAAGMSNLAYWDENISVGDFKSPDAYHCGLYFQNKMNTDVLISICLDRGNMKLAFIGKSTEE